MGGGRGLLGLQPLGPVAGAPGRVCRARRPPAAPPFPSRRRDLPRAAVPSRVVLAFVPGIAHQAPAAAARWASLWSGPPPSAAGPAPPMHIRTLSCAPAASWAAFQPDTPPTAGRCRPPPAPPPDCIALPTHLRCAAMAFHHTHRQTAALSDLDSPWRDLSWPQPVDIDSHSWLSAPPRGASQPFISS